MYQSDLPDKFFRVRRHIGLTQENIALEIGITPEGYGKIERGKTRITEERLNQISAIFGIEPWQIIQLIADELILLLIERKNFAPPRK
jgi:transcriptional regulator with XRE-family HTH domain